MVLKFMIVLIIVCIVISLGISLLKDIKWYRKHRKNDCPDITAALDRWHQAELEFQKKDKEKN